MPEAFYARISCKCITVYTCVHICMGVTASIHIKSHHRGWRLTNKEGSQSSKCVELNIWKKKNYIHLQVNGSVRKALRSYTC